MRARVCGNWQVGYRPTYDLASEMRVHLCYESDGPIKLAASLKAKGKGTKRPASGDAAAAAPADAAPKKKKKQKQLA